MRGPAELVGVPKAVIGVNTCVAALYEYFDTFTPFTLLLFSTLNASAISCSFVSWKNTMSRETRGEMSNCEGSLSELRVNPGAMSFAAFRSLFRSEFTFGEYG